METQSGPVSSYLLPSDHTTVPPEPFHDAMVTGGGGISPVYVVIILPCSVIIVIISIIVVYVVVTRLDETVHRRRETPGDWDCCHPVERISFHDEDSLDERLAMRSNDDVTEMVSMTTFPVSGSPAEQSTVAFYGDYFGVNKSNGPVGSSQNNVALAANDRCYNHSNQDRRIPQNQVKYTNEVPNIHGNHVHKSKTSLGNEAHRKPSADCVKSQSIERKVSDFHVDNSGDIGAHATDCVDLDIAYVVSDDSDKDSEDSSLSTRQSYIHPQTGPSFSQKVLELDEMKTKNAARRSSSASERNKYLKTFTRS